MKCSGTCTFKHSQLCTALLKRCSRAGIILCCPALPTSPSRLSLSRNFPFPTHPCFRHCPSVSPSLPFWGWAVAGHPSLPRMTGKGVALAALVYTLLFLPFSLYRASQVEQKSGASDVVAVAAMEQVPEDPVRTRHSEPVRPAPYKAAIHSFRDLELQPCLDLAPSALREAPCISAHSMLGRKQQSDWRRTCAGVWSSVVLIHPPTAALGCCRPSESASDDRQGYACIRLCQ